VALGECLVVGGIVVDEEFRRSFQRGRRMAALHDLRLSRVDLLLGLKVPPHIVREIVDHANST
jgi:hypothetical protein